MTSLPLPPASVSELAVVERSAALGNLLADNLHAAYIPPLLPAWFVMAPPYLREALRDSMKQGHQTRAAVSAVLAQIMPIEQFAEPLLKAALVAHGHGDNRFAVGEVPGFQVSQNLDLGVIGNSGAVGHQYATQRVDQRVAHQPLPFGIVAVEHLVAG